MAYRAKQKSITGSRLGSLLCACICILMLNGCTYLWRDPPETGMQAKAKTQADDAQPGDAQAMNGAMGMKTEPLFAEKLYSKNKRIDRLENVVQTLHTVHSGAHDKTEENLDEIHSEISALKNEVKELREAQEAMNAAPARNTVPDETAMSQDAAMGGPQNLSPDAQQGAETENAAIKPETKRPSPPPSSGDKFTVRNIRFGEHSNKTRIVLDISGKPDYAISLDNVEKILLIELHDGAWTASAEGKPNSPLIASYSAQGMGQGQGNMLVISLKHVTEIVNRDVLPPTSGSGGYRLVIDLYSRPVHS